MNGTPATAQRTGLTAPRRNRFFHGKMMDVHHFEMETAYGIGMRRLLNRLVTGSGVVCGLDVVPRSGCAVEITSGVAIDRWGREIVIPTRTPPIPIPRALIDRVCGQQQNPAEEDSRDKPRAGHTDDEYEPTACVTVVLCYYECETDPVAVLAGDCSTSTPCAPGAIREQYRIEFEPGAVDPIELSCRFPDVLAHGELDYAALAKWITRDCPTPPRNPCIPLANVHLNCRDDACEIEDIDISIRPIVFGNDILIDILTRIVEEERAGSHDRR
ncbi:hypothetical protein ABZ540_35200 [Nocardia xishanensis]|uniref:hypothetical protein n=1 Tax=Nocardia xishanensis TaxID=238964 RepID=UPI0033D6A798